MNTEAFIRHYTRKIISEARERKRLGGISKGSKEALGLADTNPKELLKRLGIQEKETDVGSLISNFASNSIVSEAFGNASSPSSNAHEIYIRVLGDEDSGLPPVKRAAISPFQAWRYVKAAINAAAKVGILTVDPNKISYQVFEEDKEKFLVRVETP